MVFCEFEPEATLKILSRFIIHDLAKIISNFLLFNRRVYVNIDKVIIEPLNDFFPEADEEEQVKLSFIHRNGRIECFEVNTHKKTVIYHPFSFLYYKELSKGNGYTNFDMYAIKIGDKLYVSGFSYFLDPELITRTLRLYPANLEKNPLKPRRMRLFCEYVDETRIMESCVIQ